MVYLHDSLWLDSISSWTQGRNQTRIITERRIEVSYKPLPDNLELKSSSIHGYGVFAVEPISQGDYLGMSHINAPELIRTPLGGYINQNWQKRCEPSQASIIITFLKLTFYKDFLILKKVFKGFLL